MKNVQAKYVLSKKVQIPLTTSDYYFNVTMDKEEITSFPAIINVTVKNHDGTNFTSKDLQYQISVNEGYTISVADGKTEMQLEGNKKNEETFAVTINKENSTKEDVILTFNVEKPYKETLEKNINVEKVYQDESGANAPALTADLTPVVWDDDTQKWKTTTKDDINWYDYCTKKWANAMTTDGSMWVWIPKYAYKITSNYHTGSQTSGGNIDIVFVDKNNKDKDGNTYKTNYPSTNNDGMNDYVVHPTFVNNPEKGGWNIELSGIWVAKFEASHSDATVSNVGSNNTLKVVPGVQSWRNITISNIYTTCLNYNTTLKSHQMKNSEWGAIAYLAQSSYGKNSEVWINPNSNHITGQAGTSAGAGQTTLTYSYENTIYGVNSSTTGNIYGIYDMSGGAWEYTASYVNNGNGNLNNNGASLINGGRYTKDVYLKGSSDNYELNYQANSGIYGNAVYETSNTGNSNSGSWYGDRSSFPSTGAVFFVRGGGYNYESATGAFAFSCAGGNADNILGFRPVLVVQ